ncbi:hypothetical protein KVR01_011709 [Diaporthe batatas]|uniref:uncharacterized protein n=1 Tax=Diaporthe batatas TaxID=748121 RepID=UPI001D04BE81|nr:uncharacterized protein KVR01_011709 [Diaporthe batatas]KAG8158587.1 hypothetical protein KVR01_011709 [Diaporthe batatas]
MDGSGPAPAYESPNAHLYQPLSSPDSIRILTLFESDSEDDDLEFYLTEHRLSDFKGNPERYTALSYAWGDPKLSHEIWLGDERFLVSANLESALRHLRRRDSPVRLWVDAVCINQADVVEKNSQVQQMRNIFSAATDTIAWLGPAEGNTALSAWNFLERHSEWALNGDREIDYTIPAKLETDLLSFRGEFRDLEIDVLSRPWFRRLWVFQEAVLSRHLLVQCGYRRITWDDFSRTVLQSHRRDDRYGFSIQNDGRRDIVQAITRARREYLQLHGATHHPELPQSPEASRAVSPSGMLNILRLLHMGRYLQASDARDKIFGLLGIAEGIDTTDARFRVDYSLSPRRLHEQFAKNLIATTNSLEILSYVDFTVRTGGLGPSATVETPSWVPCWDYDSPFISNGGHDRSSLTVLDTLPTESTDENDARKIRVANSKIIWSNCGSQSAVADTMEVSGRVVGHIGALTGTIRMNGYAQTLFNTLLDDVEDEDERFTLSMALWARKLTSTGDDSNFRADKDFIARTRADGVQWQELDHVDEGDPNLAFVQSRLIELRDVRLHLKQAAVENSSLPVYRHLYRRGHSTTSWSGQNLDTDVRRPSPSVIDAESIVDGRRLATCVTDTVSDSGSSGDGAGQLALVPASARTGDVIIQISGARVPFVVRKLSDERLSIDIGTDGDELSPERLIKAIKSRSFPWKLIGECLLNDFEELAEDFMDSRFRLV